MCSGYENKIKEYYVDIDNDGIKELVCQGFLATESKSYGNQSVIVYKKDGYKTLIGTVPLMDMGLIKSKDETGNIYESYNENTNQIVIIYGTLSEKYGESKAISISNIRYTELSMDIMTGIILNDK